MFRAASRLMAAVPSAPRGLYGGKQILHGHNISHSHRKTLRVWRPNIQVCLVFTGVVCDADALGPCTAGRSATCTASFLGAASAFP